MKENTRGQLTEEITSKYGIEQLIFGLLTDYYAAQDEAAEYDD